MTRWLDETEGALGRRTAWVALAAVAIGLIVFAVGVRGGHSPRAFGELIASWLFFAGAAAGALAFRAFFRLVDARWARPLATLGATQVGFAPVALGVLVVILAGAGLAPWLHSDGGTWLRAPFLVTRQLLLFGALFGFAYYRLRPGPGEAERPPTRAAVIYCLLFAVVLSIWAFDFVLGPDPSFQSTIIGPYLFMSAFMAGTGVVALLALRRGELGEKERRDVGAFMLALAVFWGYLFWSQYLPIWYGNLPDEVAFGLRRGVNGQWILVLAVIGCVFAVPFVVLLHPKGRGSSRVLSGLIVIQLLGLWLNCHMMVVPSLSAEGGPAIGPSDVLIALGMLGAFMLASARGLRPAVAT